MAELFAVIGGSGFYQLDEQFESIRQCDLIHLMGKLLPSYRSVTGMDSSWLFYLDTVPHISCHRIELTIGQISGR